MYSKVNTDMNFVEREKEVEQFWKEDNTFKKSMEQREGCPTYTFYDGPPTANGKPHIGHVLTRVIKDMIPRYQTMKGKMVPIWEKYMLTVDEAVQYFGIGEKKIRMLISENTDTDYCFTVQVGNKSLINRHKFEEFLNQTTSL